MYSLLAKMAQFSAAGDLVCSGVSFYSCMAGTVLVFICGLLSMRAETSTSTDQVQELILDGKLIVCVP